MARILARRSAESWPGRLYAFETVATETPTASATVFAVTRATQPTSVPD